MATAATSSRPPRRYIRSSISSAEIFSPPRLIMSLSRPWTTGCRRVGVRRCRRCRTSRPSRKARVVVLGGVVVAARACRGHGCRSLRGSPSGTSLPSGSRTRTSSASCTGRPCVPMIDLVRVVEPRRVDQALGHAEDLLQRRAEDRPDAGGVLVGQPGATDLQQAQRCAAGRRPPPPGGRSSAGRRRERRPRP